jgi:hypothetical protein
VNILVGDFDFETQANGGDHGCGGDVHAADALDDAVEREFDVTEPFAKEAEGARVAVDRAIAGEFPLRGDLARIFPFEKLALDFLELRMTTDAAAGAVLGEGGSLGVAGRAGFRSSGHSW